MNIKFPYELTEEEKSTLTIRKNELRSARDRIAATIAEIESLETRYNSVLHDAGVLSAKFEKNLDEMDFHAADAKKAIASAIDKKRCAEVEKLSAYRHDLNVECHRAHMAIVPFIARILDYIKYKIRKLISPFHIVDAQMMDHHTHGIEYVVNNTPACILIAFSLRDLPTYENGAAGCFDRLDSAVSALLSGEPVFTYPSADELK